MAATQTVPQVLRNRNFTPIAPQHGVITLNGYGINVHVDRGHLFIQDGIGAARREGRFARVGHGISRLVVIGSDGAISLAALRWLADQNAAFVMLDRDGSVLAATGPRRSSNSRLRRAQALAHESGVAVQIARELIHQKLLGQERLARDILRNQSVAETIASVRVALTTAETTDRIRTLESQAAQAYWSAWWDLPITYPKGDLKRIPKHWLTFGTRKSPLTNSPRLAINPSGAALNYLYALLESEACLASAAVGLDPGLGVLHVDTDARDSFACDLMEAVRPQVDAYLLDWIMRSPFRREWFFEQRDGNCRLMGTFAARLSETARTWAHAVAPFAELVCRMLSAKSTRGLLSVATHLTQTNRRNAKGIPKLRTIPLPKPPNVCKLCACPIRSGTTYCDPCATVASTQALVEAAKIGRVVAHTSEAELKRAATLRRHHAARKNWNPSDMPEWLSEEAYRQKIQPRLGELAIIDISSALGISGQYAIDIRSGKRIPHPRHWQTLAELTGIKD